MNQDDMVLNSKGKLVNRRAHDAALLATQKRLIKDPNYYTKIASKGGLSSTHRPMKDPEYARRAVNARWDKYRAAKAENEQ